MGRKIKTILMLVVVLAMIYTQHSGVIYAEEPVEPATPSELEKPSEPTKPEIEKFQIQIPEPDGKNGYYISHPQAEITHVSERGITKYRLWQGEKILAEGGLKEKDEKVLLPKEQFCEGTQNLRVWMEDEEGHELPEFILEKTFMIDTTAPDAGISVPGGFESWYKNQAVVSVRGMDAGSGVQKISCCHGRECVGVAAGEAAQFRIDQASIGGKGVSISVLVEDGAGNVCQKARTIYIDRQAPQVAIDGAVDYMISSQPITVTYEAEEENQLKECKAQAEWESVNGEQVLLDAEDWQDNGTKHYARQQLVGDGTYQLYVQASDRAGFTAEKKLQVIIDKENPVIRYVDQLQGKYLKSFVWNYLQEELIQDYTTYIYSVRLDGQLYSMGDTIRTEGRHSLEVTAKDAAGNKAVATADFTVDHTEPEILIQNAEDGKAYEEQCSLTVGVKNKEDQITQIVVNGEPQKLNAKETNYAYVWKEYKNYEVKVQARDRAGNISEKTMLFSVVPKPTFLEKIINPVTEKVTGTRTRQAAIQGQKNENAKDSSVLIAIILVLGVGIAGIYLNFYIRRQQKHRE